MLFNVGIEQALLCWSCSVTCNKILTSGTLPKLDKKEKKRRRRRKEEVIRRIWAARETSMSLARLHTTHMNTKYDRWPFDARAALLILT